MSGHDSVSNETRKIADALYMALNGIYLEEINGVLCALPETLPDPFGEEGETDRANRCCPQCARHWRRTKDALRAYEDHRASLSGASRAASSGGVSE